MKPLYKYFPLFVALLVIAILGTGIYGGAVVRSLFYERITADLADTAQVLRQLIQRESLADIDLFCKTAGTGFSRVTVVDAEGKVLGDSLAEPEEMENHGSRPEIKDAYLGITGSSVRYSATLKRNMVYLALPLFNFNGRPIVLRTATPFRSLSGDLRGAYIRIAIVGGVILLLVTLLGFLLIRRVNDALHIIRNAVRQYALGNLAYRPSVYRPAALKQIADTISNLAGDLVTQAAEATGQRDELEAVFAGMEEAVIVVDADFAIKEMNEAAYKLTDFTPGEAAGKNLLLVFRNSDIHEIVEQVKTTKGRVERDIVLFTDHETHHQVHGSMVTGATGEGPRIILVLNDVSRLKDLEQVRKDFVANVSHELKTPITAIKGYVETLLEDDFDDHERTKNFLKITLNQVDRLNAIVEDLLMISRLEKDSGPVPDLAECDLNEIVRGAAVVHEVRAKNSGIELVVTCPPNETVLFDCVLLEQAVANLVDNAIKYSERGGSVEVSVEAEPDLVAIRVIDKGCGIPAEHLDRIFERFYRVDKGRSRELGGTGLGLSIVKHVAGIHGGEVTVTSTEGEGSTFSILLPRTISRSG